MKGLHLSAQFNGVIVEVDVTKTLENNWFVVTDFCNMNGTVQWGTKGMGNSVNEVLHNHFRQWLGTDALDTEIVQVIEDLVMQLEDTGSNIETTRLEPDPRTFQMREFSGTSNWLPENRRGKYVRHVNPKSYPMDIKLNSYFVVGTISKLSDYWYVDIIIREKGTFYKVDKFLVVGKDLIGMLMNRLGTMKRSEISEVEKKCRVAIEWFKVQ